MAFFLVVVVLLFPPFVAALSDEDDAEPTVLPPPALADFLLSPFLRRGVDDPSLDFRDRPRLDDASPLSEDAAAALDPFFRLPAVLPSVEALRFFPPDAFPVPAPLVDLSPAEDALLRFLLPFPLDEEGAVVDKGDGTKNAEDEEPTVGARRAPEPGLPFPLD